MELKIEGFAQKDSIVVANIELVKELDGHVKESHLPVVQKNNGALCFKEIEFGFRVNHSIETVCCYFIEVVKANLDKGGVVGGVFWTYVRHSE